MIYKLKVFPNSKKQEINKKQDILYVYVKEKPVHNRANIEVIKLLSKYFNVPQKQIKLRGLSSKNKFVEIK